MTMEPRKKPVRQTEQKANRPLWLFLCEPGMADLLAKELSFRKIIARKTRLTKLFMRHYDVLLVPDVQITGPVKTTRLALHVLICPVFGKVQVSDKQMDLLVAACLREKSNGFVSSVAGSAFNRQDFGRWITKRLTERGVTIADDAKRPLWLIVIDQAYYFCFPRFNHHELAGRISDREGALPATIASGMLFAAEPKTGDVIWDLTTGSGTLLGEASAMAPDAALIGTDTDKLAIGHARQKLASHKRAVLSEADARSFDPGRSDVSLLLANLPWGKQFKTEEGNAAFYEALLRNALNYVAPKWRGCFLTSDSEAFVDATSAIGGLDVARIATIKVRGEEAVLWRITAL